MAGFLRIELGLENRYPKNSDAGFVRMMDHLDILCLFIFLVLEEEIFDTSKLFQIFRYYFCSSCKISKCF